MAKSPTERRGTAWNWRAVVGAALLQIGCLAPKARPTEPPRIDVHPWKEGTVHSAASGTAYTFMRLDGPAGAPVMLLLHGGVFDHRLWYYVAPLCSHATLVALRYPDRSPFYRGRVTDWGDVIADFVSAAGWRPAYVAGVSNGAYGAIAYASRPDIHLSGLVIASAVLYASSRKEIRARRRYTRIALGLSPPRLLGLIQKRALGRTYPDPGGPIDQRSLFYLRPYSYYHQVFAAARNQGDRPQDTQAIDCPVLLLHGTDDDIMPFAAAKDGVGAFPHATLMSFPGAGHELVFSHGPQVAAAIASAFFGTGDDA